MQENASFGGGSVTYGVTSAIRVDLDHEDKGPTTERSAYAHLDLKITWSDTDGEGVDGPFSLEATVTGEFLLGEAHLIDPVQLKRWIELNATHLLWSYARAYLSSVTSFSRHAPLTIFTIAVPRPQGADFETGEHDVVDASPHPQ